MLHSKENATFSLSVHKEQKYGGIEEEEEEERESNIIL